MQESNLMASCRDVFGSLIQLTVGLANYFIYKRFTVQALSFSVEFVIQINLEYDRFITV